MRKGRVSLSNHAYFITTVTNERVPWFTDMACARLAVAEMRRLHEDGFVESLAWVVMPDHVHWLLQLQGAQSLARVVRLFKGRVARKINQMMTRSGTFWQRSYYDHGIRTDEDLRAVARYLVANPLRKGLVTCIGDYSHWDAVWL